MKEGEISSGSERAPLVLGAATDNWGNNIGGKSVQYIKLGHTPRVQAIEPNPWDNENTVRATEKYFERDLQLSMTEPTDNSKLLKTLVCLERQNDNILEECNTYRKNAINKEWNSRHRRNNHRPH